MKHEKVKMLCEAAIFIAMAEILSLIKLYEFPNGRIRCEGHKRPFA